MKHQLSEADREFQAQFEACKSVPSDFNHRAHVRLAYVYLVEHNDEEACQLIRKSLLRFLQHHGVDVLKFHETMTRAWILGVRHLWNWT